MKENVLTVKLINLYLFEIRDVNETWQVQHVYNAITCVTLLPYTGGHVKESYSKDTAGQGQIRPKGKYLFWHPRINMETDTQLLTNGPLQDTHVYSSIIMSFFLTNTGRFRPSRCPLTLDQDLGGAWLCLLGHNKPPAQRPNNRQLLLQKQRGQDRLPFPTAIFGQPLMPRREEPQTDRRHKTRDRVTVKRRTDVRHFMFPVTSIWGLTKEEKKLKYSTC